MVGQFIYQVQEQPYCSWYHQHHIALVARISPTLSRHSSLSFIALGRSSGQQPVSSHSCWMYVRAGRPAFVGIHKSTSLMSSRGSCFNSRGMERKISQCYEEAWQTHFQHLRILKERAKARSVMTATKSTNFAGCTISRFVCKSEGCLKFYTTQSLELMKPVWPSCRNRQESPSHTHTHTHIYSTNALRKGMNPIILLLAMGK